MTALAEVGDLRELSDTTHRPVSVAAAVRRRKWPCLAAALVVGVGMLYTLVWGLLVQHGSHWVVPGDIWGTFRAAHYVGWGDIGDVYSPQTALVSLPLVTVVLAPVAMLSGHFGLTESLPYFLPHPTAWLLLGPAELLIGASVLFPLDALAEHLGIAARRRIALCAVETVLVWPVLALWGHPEDALALTFALYGLLAALRGRWAPAGWLWGAALATQPLVVLMLPLAFALAPVRRWAGLALKSAAPAVALVLVPLVQQWHQTSKALFQQPNYPTIDHATPWIAFAPVLSPAHWGVTRHFAEVVSGGRTRFTSSVVTSRVGEIVAAGPGRLVAIALSLVIGVWVYRRRPSPQVLIWWAATGLSLRCVFESVMNPYYLWPPLVLLVLAAATTTQWRFWFVVLDAAIVSVYSYHRTGPWMYWVPMMVLLGIALFVGRPARHGVDPSPPAGGSSELVLPPEAVSPVA